MIFISKFKEVYQIKQIVSQVAKTFNYPVSIVFDKIFSPPVKNATIGDNIEDIMENPKDEF